MHPNESYFRLGLIAFDLHVREFLGDDIVDMIKEKYKESYSVSGVYKLLKRMGMSWVSARSIHTKSNLEVQEAFKKTSQIW